MNRRAFAAAAVACAVPARGRAQALKSLTVGTAPTEDILAALLGRDDGDPARRAGAGGDLQRRRARRRTRQERRRFEIDQAHRAAGLGRGERDRQLRVDASTLDNPALSQALAADVRLLSWDFDVLARRFLWAAYFCTADYAQRNPDVVSAFRQVIAREGGYANAHPAETVDTIAAFTGMEARVIRAMTRTTIGSTLDPKMLQVLIDAAAAYKAIPAVFDARSMIA